MTAAWEPEAPSPAGTDREQRLALGLELLGAIIAGEIVRDLNKTDDERRDREVTPGHRDGAQPR